MLRVLSNILDILYQKICKQANFLWMILSYIPQKNPLIDKLWMLNRKEAEVHCSSFQYEFISLFYSFGGIFSHCFYQYYFSSLKVVCIYFCTAVFWNCKHPTPMKCRNCCCNKGDCPENFQLFYPRKHQVGEFSIEYSWKLMLEDLKLFDKHTRTLYLPG